MTSPTAELSTLWAALDTCLTIDRPFLRQRLRIAGQRLRQGKPAQRMCDEIHAAIEASMAKVGQRLAERPQATFPDQLPVSARREEIQAAILRHQVVVVAGETGSGKTTQLPKICLEAGRGVAGLIGCTQPRRIAARSIASRIAEELHSEVGHAVGYKVRFTDRVSERSYIKMMTDGILLAEMQNDRFLNAYDTLIIDEAHERNLNIDFLLGYLKQLLSKRQDLKLIITSATIDTARFAAHFNAPVVAVEGRTYPVEVVYRPPLNSQSGEVDLQQAILDAVDESDRLQPQGDILIFLPGEREIRETAESLRKHHPPQTEIVPLYARLSAADQNRVFQPGAQRRIVLATNVAETSLTVPRIRTVIDPGVARINRYSVRAKVQRLQVEPISQASANQRKGRCGRVGPGVCFRLYEAADFENREAFTAPEILRTSLAAVILRMLDLGLGQVSAFPFVEAPKPQAITDGYKLLEELGAVSRRHKAQETHYALTDLGRQLAKLPVDPRIGRMILAAKQYNALREVLIIAAALSVQDPRERPLAAQQAADEAHKIFTHELSDFVSLLSLWKTYHEQARHLSTNKLRKWCQAHFLAYLRMREWHDVHQQVEIAVKDLGWRLNEVEASYEEIHRALLSGLLGNIAWRETPAPTPSGEKPSAKRRPTIAQYQGARGVKPFIHPGSGLAKRAPRWIMAAELAETTKLYARTVAEIQPEWIEAAAGDLCRRSYVDPHWEKRAAQVTAFEQVTLYGLTIVARRKINYGPLDPQTAHEIFLRQALVAGEYRTRAAFFEHNRDLIAQVEDLEHKTRRGDILLDEQQLFAFYAARIPAHIYSGAAFEQWYRQAVRDDPQCLFLTPQSVAKNADLGLEGFPTALAVNGVALPLRYRFEPGDENDGVTLDVPAAMLNQLDPARCEWLVPGLLQEKITALIKSLPKAVRKFFVPAPDFAKAAFEALTEQPCVGQTCPSLRQALGAFLQRISGVEIAQDAWRVEQLPLHLQMNFRVYNEEEQVLAQGRDLALLRAQWQDHTHALFTARPAHPLETASHRAWDFADLPESVALRREGVVVQAYPALVDNETTVAVRLFEQAALAIDSHRQGLGRLYLLVLASALKELRRKLPVSAATCLQYAALDTCEALKQDTVMALVEGLFLAEPLPRARSTFYLRLEQGQKQLFAQATRQMQFLAAALEHYHQITRLLSALPPGLNETKKAMETHVTGLIYPGFARHTPLAYYQHLPRYLKAVRIRLERLPQSPAKDMHKAKQIEPLFQAWQTTGKTLPNQQQVMDFRWQLEELRVSLFAQELGVAHSVSLDKMRDKWRELQA